MTYELLIRLFFRWLKDNNVYNEYIANLKLLKRISNKEELFNYHISKRLFKYTPKMSDVNFCKRKDVINIYRIEDMINFSFHWDGTKEGHHFWSHLDKKWRSYCYEQRINHE
mgnify:CR=1 FL=1